MPESSQNQTARDELIEIVTRDPDSAGGDEVWATDLVNAFANEVLREDAEQRKAMSRTERSYWQDIADALNAAEKVGMGVGIDLDGTLTDHNAWSVIWDRDVKQWVLAGYDDEETAS